MRPVCRWNMCNDNEYCGWRFDGEPGCLCRGRFAAKYRSSPDSLGKNFVMNSWHGWLDGWKCVLLLINTFIFRWTNRMQAQHCYSHSCWLSVGGKLHRLHFPAPQRQQLQRHQRLEDPPGLFWLQHQKQLWSKRHGTFLPPPYPNLISSTKLTGSKETRLAGLHWVRLWSGPGLNIFCWVHLN